MFKKITIGMFSLMVALLFTDLSFALEPGRLGYSVQQAEINEIPTVVTQPIFSYYHPESSTVSIDPEEASAVMKDVLLRLEEANVDTRQLIGDMPLSVYALPGSFGLYGAFTVWFATGDTQNSILLGGIRESEREAGAYKQTLAHEMGHAVANRYFNPDIKAAYRKLRGIPDAWITSTMWGQQPDEIFAEDFAYLFGSPEGFQNRSAKQTLKPDEASALKSLIVSALPLLREPITAVNGAAEQVIALQKQGVIQLDAFMPSGESAYAAAPITNEEWIHWVYTWNLQNDKPDMYLDVLHRKQVYGKLYKSYTGELCSWVSLMAIVQALAPVMHIPDIPAAPNTNNQPTHGEAALWLSSLL